jgi:hypothetical protein
MVKIAGVGMERGDVGDRLGEVVGRAVVGLAGEQCQELCPEAVGEPGRAVGTPGPKFGRHRGAIDHHDGMGRRGDEVLVAGGVWGAA